MADIRRREHHGILTAEAWNARAPIGTPVRYFPVRGHFEHIETRTRSIAWALGHGDVVVAVDGKTGGVLIDHLILIEDGEQLERMHIIAEKLLTGTQRLSAQVQRANACLGKLATIITAAPINWDEHPQLRGQFEGLLAEIAAIDDPPDPREHPIVKDKEQPDA